MVVYAVAYIIFFCVYYFAFLINNLYRQIVGIVLSRNKFFVRIDSFNQVVVVIVFKLKAFKQRVYDGRTVQLRTLRR